MKSVIGTMISANFFQEALMIPKRDEETLAELNAQVVYSAITSKWKSPGVLLVLNMSPEAGTCRVTAFTYIAMSGALPPWLRDNANTPS
jgi:hypothetical protein